MVFARYDVDGQGEVARMGRERVRGIRGRMLVMGCVALCAALCALLVFAYNPEQDQVNGAPAAARWQNNSFTWELNPTVGSNVSTTGGDTIPTAIQNSFNTWQNTGVNGQILNALSITVGPATSITDPNSSDCVNVISFNPTSSVSFPTGAIAFTDVVTSSGPPPTSYPCSTAPTSRTCSLPSCLIDSDIAFNPKEQFSTASATPSGSFDVQSTATHEIGHMLGLDHSGIAHAVMYPFGDSGQGQQRYLAVDDAVGFAFLYPASSFATATGVISGTVFLNMSGAFAAHVVAVDTASGDAMVDGLSNSDGTYKLVGVPPGTYNVMVLPLAPNSDAGIYTLDNFGGWACGFGENSPPCCDPTTDKTCTGTLSNPTNYSGKFY
jgi:hypothetical protein